MNFDDLYTNPMGQVSRAEYIPALITLLAAMAFFLYMVTGLTAQYCVLVLLYPSFVLLAQRLRDMGVLAWLALIPFVLLLANMSVLISGISLSEALTSALQWGSIAVFAAFALWGCLSAGKE